MANKFKASKKSLGYKENIKSWNNGNKKKIISEPTKLVSKPMRNGIILT